MTVSFLDPGAEIDNPLDPITPLRLVFLVRRALAEVGRTAVAPVVIYDEVWARRAELADRVAPALQAYRREKTESMAAGSAGVIVDLLAGLVAGAGSFSLLVIGAAKVFTLPLRIEVPGGLWGVALVAAGLLGAAMILPDKVSEGLAQESDESYLDEVIEVLTEMIREIAQREEERAHGELLHQMRTPSHVEFGSSATVRSESFREVMALVSGHVTSAIGVAGPRGAGKTTLLRLLCDGPNDWVGVYLPVPVNAAEGQFARMIYGAVVREVLLSRGVRLSARGRTRVSRGTARDIVWASQRLDEITWSSARQWGRKAAIARWGVSAEASRQFTLTERELGPADWAEKFRSYMRGHHIHKGRPIVVAIDELDKITDSDRAIDVINGIKDLFHIEDLHVVVSVSDDALRRFALRGIPMRDAFDTAFDAVIDVRRLRAEESYDLLRRRAPRFPYPAALFCHAWSGGLPRDLIRTARSCVAIQRRRDVPVAVTDLARAIVRRDVTDAVDAVIRRSADNAHRTRIEALLELRRLVQDDEAPLRRQFAGQMAEGAADDDPLYASLKAFIDVAGAVIEYYSVPRDSREWARGIRSGKFLRHADHLAEAKAALATHPSEAAWKVARAREQTGLSTTGRDGHGPQLGRS